MIIMPGEDVKVTISAYSHVEEMFDIERRVASEPDVTCTKVDTGSCGDYTITLEGEFAGILNALWDYIQGDDDPIERMTEVLSDMERI